MSDQFKARCHMGLLALVVGATILISQRAYAASTESLSCDPGSVGHCPSQSYCQLLCDSFAPGSYGQCVTEGTGEKCCYCLL